MCDSVYWGGSQVPGPGESMMGQVHGLGGYGSEVDRPSMAGGIWMRGRAPQSAYPRNVNGRLSPNVFILEFPLNVEANLWINMYLTSFANSTINHYPGLYPKGAQMINNFDPFNSRLEGSLPLMTEMNVLYHFP